MNKLLEEYQNLELKLGDYSELIKKEIIKVLEVLEWTDKYVKDINDIDDFFINDGYLYYNYYGCGESQQDHIPIEYFDIPLDQLKKYHEEIINKQKQIKEQKQKEEEELRKKNSEISERKLYEELKKKYGDK